MHIAKGRNIMHAETEAGVESNTHLSRCKVNMCTPEHVSGAERGASAERAKYSRSAERVFIQRPERSFCLAPVPLRYRSHHEPRACTNPPRIHLCLQQLTKLSAYTSKIVRCEGEMEFVKYFQKQTDRSHRCTIPVKKLDDN